MAPGIAQTESPTSLSEQLFLALRIGAIANEAAAALVLHPLVSDALNALTPAIQATRRGGTEACGACAIELISAPELDP